MAATIDATVGGSTANSYVTLAEADAFFEEQPLSTAWDDATDDQKNRALIAATRRLDQEVYVGSPASPLTGTSGGTTQALQWPRSGAGYLTTVIPAPIKHATMKLAYSLIDDAELLQDSGLEGFDRAKVGPIEVEVRHAQESGALPADVQREIEDLLGTGRLQFRMVRG